MTQPRQTGRPTERSRGFQTAVHHRKPRTVFGAVRRVVESGPYDVREVHESDRRIVFSPRPDGTGGPGSTGVELICEVGGLGEDAGQGPVHGSLVVVTRAHPPGAVVTRADRRAETEVVRAVLRAVEDDLLSTLPPDAPRPRRRRTLADLTGQRAWLGALVLLGLYLVPVALVWGIGRLDVSVFGDNRWVGVTVALVLGLGLVVALTVRLGGWFRGIDFGEEYMLTFHPGWGYALGWWRLVCQLGSLVLVAVLSSGIEDAATAADISDERTEGLPSYAERAPVPPGGEPLGDPRFSQNEYDDGPNARIERRYVVDRAFGLAEAEEYLRDPAWADGVAGGPPLGALRAITCEDGPYDISCEAEVVPPAGEPVEYSVTLQLGEANVTQDGGEPEDVGLVRLQVTYEADDSRS